jgi:hypothetical protein
MNQNTVGQWHSIRKSMEVDRTVTRALRGGTSAMRSLGTVLTPMDHRERTQPQEYLNRLLRTFLFPAYDDAVSGIVDKPFQKAIELKDTESLPENLRYLEEDCDRQDTNITQLGRMLMDSLADTGLAFVLVDKPSNMVLDEEGARPMNLLEESESDVRPYFVFVHPDRVVNWSWRSDSTGKRILAAVAIYEEQHRTDHMTLEENTVQMVRVWYEDHWELWERVNINQISGLPTQVMGQVDLLMTAKQTASQSSSTERDPYHLVSEGVNPLGVVPLAWVNVSPRGSDPFWAVPPLIDLAWKNIDDWLITSSLSNNLHWHSYPALSVSGASSDLADGTQTITYGAGATIISRDPNMEVGFVETSGAAAQKLMERLRDIRVEEQSLGLAPFLEQVTAGSTATAVDAAGARAQSRVQSWTEQLEWLMYEAYEYAMLWEVGDDELPESFDIDIFRDFGIPTRAQTDLVVLTQARQAKQITQETYLRELQKRGTLGEEVDVEAEVAETTSEGPDLASMTNGDAAVPSEEATDVVADAPSAQASSAQAAGVPAADTALNGAQVQAAAAIVQQVAARQLPRDSGVAQLVEFFNLPADKAERIMGAVGKTFFIETAAPAAQPQV